MPLKETIERLFEAPVGKTDREEALRAQVTGSAPPRG